MKTLVAICVAGFCLAASAMDRFAALSMIESGDNDFAIGPQDERGRYQFSHSVIVEFHIDADRLTNSVYALAQAQQIQQARTAAFVSVHHRLPTDAEWYLLWHRPASVLSKANTQPATVDCGLARRFANLCRRR